MLTTPLLYMLLLISAGIAAEEIKLPDKAEWLPGEIYRDKDGEIKLDPSVVSQRPGVQGQQPREQVHRTTNRQVRIRWDAPTASIAGKPLTSPLMYKIYLFTSNQRQERIFDAGSRTEYTLQNLQTGHYTVRITAHTRQNIDGRFSVPVKLIIE